MENDKTNQTMNADLSKTTGDLTIKEIVEHFADKIKHYKPRERRQIIGELIQTVEAQIQNELSELQRQIELYQSETN
jgi:phenylalanyl-tRNA synthetase alpha subunit